jgi:hypothetical protein
MNLSVKGRCGLWGLLMSGLLVLAVAVAGGVDLPVKNAQKYECTSSCFNNYRWCLMQGNPQPYCQNQYQVCTFNCAAHGAARPNDSQ